MQTLSALAGADLLHIKGVAADPTIVQAVGAGSDVDVLVRPRCFDALADELRTHGWREYDGFDTGSPFGHAATFVHDAWGFADVHRRFPGIRIDDEQAFELLWRSRTETSLAEIDCQVPSFPAQVLLMVLNVARSPGASERRLRAREVWQALPAEVGTQVHDLVAECQAEVAFAAGLGELHRYRRRREYLLWKAVSEGGTRSEEWVGRVLAASSVREAVRLVLRAPRVNRLHLAHQLGHEPGRAEVAREFVARPFRGLTEESGRLRELLRRCRRASQ